MVWTIQGIGPEHAYFKDSGRVNMATDEEAVQALLPSKQDWRDYPTIESSHAIAEAVKRAETK